MINKGQNSYFAKGSNPIHEYHDPVVDMGDFCSIAGGVSFMGTAQHASVVHRKCVANFPFFEQWQTDYPRGEMRGPIKIGNDVWIGENAFILDGVYIGDGAIIGANATVAKDVPPYAVVVGNPAEIKKYRFTKEQIDALLRIQWWNWPREQIEESMNDLQDIEVFIKKYDKP